MTKHLSQEELTALAAPAPLPATIPAMTRRDKLLRWARLVRQHRGTVYMGSNIEHFLPGALDIHEWYGSPMEVAYADPEFRAAGLSDSTVGAAMGFFDLDLHDIHVFSCNCGGELSNREMARRIRNLAGWTAPRVGRLAAMTFFAGCYTAAVTYLLFLV